MALLQLVRSLPDHADLENLAPTGSVSGAVV